MRHKTLQKVLLFFVGLTVLGLFMFNPSSAIAANPATINFQGKIVNANGTNITDGTYSVVFRIYNTANPTMTTACTSTATCLWEETQGSVSVANGIFQVELGSACALTSSSCNNSTGGPINYATTNSLYLTMQFNGDTSGTRGGFMYPLIHMNSVPFALYSDNAGALGGLNSGNFVQLAQGLQTDASSSNASIAINKTGGTANILQLQKSGGDVMKIDNGGLLTLQPAASLTAGQSHISQILTNASSSGGTVNGYSQTITISNTISASTTNGINISMTDNSGKTNTDNGINISISGSSGAQNGVNSTVARGYGLKAVSSGSGFSSSCGMWNGSFSIGVCGASSGATSSFGGYFALTGTASGTGSAALYATNDGILAPILQLQDGTKDILTVGDNGYTTLKTSSTSAGDILTVAPDYYDTGTAYQSGTAITGVGTTWTAAMVGMEFDFPQFGGPGGSNKQTIAGFTDATHLTGSTSQTIASSGSPTSYKIYNTGAFVINNNGNVTLGNLNITGTCSGCGGSLQTAYTSGSAGDQVIQLSAANDSLVIRNPASGGSDSGTYAFMVDQQATGLIGGLDVQSAGTGNLVRIRDTSATAADVLTIADGGAVTFKSQTNSSSAFQIQNSSNGSLFNIDSSLSNITLLGNNDGQTSPWTSQGSNLLPGNRAFSTSIAANGYAYVMGGGGSSSIYYAKLNADGSTGPWTSQGSNLLPAARDLATSAFANGFIYVLGGASSAGGLATNTVYYAKLNADGSTGPWTSQGSNLLPGNVKNATSVTTNGYIHIFGGSSDGGSTLTNVVYYAKLNADGSTGPWTSQGSNLLPGNRAYSTSIAANGYAYVIGGCSAIPCTNSNVTDTVYYAKLNADGSTGPWTSQGSNLLPAKREAATSVVSNGYAYILGGTANGSTIENTVFFAKLNSDGSTGQWTNQSSNLLPAAREDATSITANGYVYVLGGTNDGGTTQFNNVYYASLSRVKIGGNLDLVGIQGQTLADSGDLSSGNTGGSITAGNITAVGNLQIQGQGNFIQSVGIAGNLSVAGGAFFQNSANSTVAFQVQNASGTSLFNIDTSTTTITFGSATNGLVLTASTYEPVLNGSARHAKVVTLVPEYPGAVMTGDGGGNTGTMTSDFCSGSSLRNIPSASNPCAASEEHNYYTWVTTAQNDYDIWVRWQVPSDFSDFAASNPITMYGWRTDSTATTTVTLSLYNSSGAICGSSTNVATGTATWTSTPLGGTITSAGCTISAGNVVDFRIQMAANNKTVRAGELTINYLSKY